MVLTFLRNGRVGRAWGIGFCMNTPRRGAFNGFVIGAALAAIAFGALIAAIVFRLGHFPQVAGLARAQRQHGRSGACSFAH